MNKTVIIDGRKIGIDHPPYVIAELSANHNGDINRAFKIMEEAKNSGADAIKLQTYTQDTITIDCDSEDFQIEGGLWGGQTLYQLYKEAHMPWEWHEPLFEKAKELGITIFSSPFDFSAVDLLEELGAPAYKIASFEIIDLPLIAYVAKTKKPMIISTGMATEEEISDAIKTARDNGCDELVVLRCVSEYPASPADYKLRLIPYISKTFDVVGGLSDHTIDNTTAITSIAMGSAVIEKHVTLDRNGGGADDSFSLEPAELSQLCAGVKVAWEALGNESFEKENGEFSHIKARRSLYVVENISAGDEFTSDNVRSIRPGYGLLPKYYNEVLGKICKVDISRGTPLSKKHF
ncbi:Putative polysaccharide biosynthesis protein [Oleispira antarctica RB-8]|uniref:Putative polysaccharide biosynthesis protein n=1 Tax=Oleispira antarctica RB-8 TaxID=698738 RepID=R4YT91_OLEAN|nr:Putative polysaccharide biosynthesis protein [Oleispira antarctica RB-8]